MMQKLFLFLSLLVSATTGLQQYVEFDAASASSMYSAGNLLGSPVFAAGQALSGGSGYWCSGGGHAAGKSVTWTGALNTRRVALGVRIDWAYAPGELKVLTSSDGANFEEARCWQSSLRSQPAFEESVMFDAPANVKAVTIAMRGRPSWNYFGINSAALIVEPSTFMLVSGITSSAGEQCVVSGTSGVELELSLEAIAAGDGRELMQLDEDGKMVNVASGECLTLIDGDTTRGGKLAMEACSAFPDLGDGRTVFAFTNNGQLKMPRVGNYCVTVVGTGVSASDVAQGADVVATSSDPQHGVKNLADGNALTYWASGPDPAGRVDVQFDFGVTKQIKSVEIEWEYPAQAFELQVAFGGKWTRMYYTSGNNLQTTRYVGPVISASALRLRMTRTHPTLGNTGGHEVFGIRSLRVLASSARLVVQDCAEAEDNTDARDKFFMVAVPDLDPSVSAATKQTAGLLGAAGEHLGNLLAELYVAMPSLAACGFKASLGNRSSAIAFMKQAASRVDGSALALDDDLAAAAAVLPAMGVESGGLRALVTKTRDALMQVSS